MPSWRSLLLVAYLVPFAYGGDSLLHTLKNTVPRLTFAYAWDLVGVPLFVEHIAPGDATTKGVEIERCESMANSGAPLTPRTLFSQDCLP